MTTVTSETLLHGAWYALEQAGRLLGSAVILANAGDLSTATGVAMLAREEFGRSRLLRQLAERIGSGESFTASHVQKICDDHANKQRAATTSITIRADQGTPLGDLHEQFMRAEPGSPKWRAIREKLQAISDAKAKRAPDDRHQMRMTAFYTDMLPEGNGWRRPWDHSEEDAVNAIRDAVNDYAAERDRLRDDVIDHDHPAMAAARTTMNPWPVLPLVRYSCLVIRPAVEPSTADKGTRPDRAIKPGSGW